MTVFATLRTLAIAPVKRRVNAWRNDRLPPLGPPLLSPANDADHEALAAFVDAHGSGETLFAVGHDRRGREWFISRTLTTFPDSPIYFPSFWLREGRSHVYPPHASAHFHTRVGGEAAPFVDALDLRVEVGPRGEGLGALLLLAAQRYVVDMDAPGLVGEVSDSDAPTDEAFDQLRRFYEGYGFVVTRYREKRGIMIAEVRWVRDGFNGDGQRVPAAP